jgi:hypothetical protein
MSSLKPSSGDCVEGLDHVHREDGNKVEKQVAAPAETRTPNWHRATNKIAHRRVRMEGWQLRQLGRRKALSNAKTNEPT